jgi:hypothetical protein
MERGRKKEMERRRDRRKEGEIDGERHEKMK